MNKDDFLIHHGPASADHADAIGPSAAERALGVLRSLLTSLEDPASVLQLPTLSQEAA